MTNPPPFSSREPGPIERYDAARVENAKTVGDSYAMHRKNPEVFVAGAQYALDRLMTSIMETTPMLGDFVAARALTILENAKLGEPQ